MRRISFPAILSRFSRGPGRSASLARVKRCYFIDLHPDIPLSATQDGPRVGSTIVAALFVRTSVTCSMRRMPRLFMTSRRRSRRSIVSRSIVRRQLRSRSTLEPLDAGTARANVRSITNPPRIVRRAGLNYEREYKTLRRSTALHNGPHRRILCGGESASLHRWHAMCHDGNLTNRNAVRSGSL